MPRLLTMALVACLSASTAGAQSLKEAVTRAAAEAAAQQAQPRSEGIPRGLLWTGVGLLGGGGFYLAAGAASSANQVTCVADSCVSNRKVLLTTGVILAAVGGALLAIGVSKSHAAPSIVFTPGGIGVRQSVPIDLGIGRFRRRR